MKKLVLLFCLLTSMAYTQTLKELVIKPTENRGGIPILRSFTESRAVVFYSSLERLKFTSSYGIDSIQDRGGGYFIVVISPDRQRLEVQCAGYKTEILHLKEGAAREFLFYTVEPKKEEAFNSTISEIATTFLITPSDASVLVDGKAVKNDSATFFSIGTHSLKVTKEGYNDYVEEIEISSAKSVFRVKLVIKEVAAVAINSTPPGAEVLIDGLTRGKTPHSMYLYPGSYALKLNLEGYTSITDKITVTADEKKNDFSFRLIKNSSILKIDITPPTANVRLNGQKVVAGKEHELPPGVYKIEADASSYFAYTNSITLVQGKTLIEKINLKKNTGVLKINVTPSDAVVKLNKEVIDINNLKELTPGIYQIEAEAPGYNSNLITAQVTLGETKTVTINLVQKVGKLQFSINPAQTECNLSQEGIVKYSWKGLKIINQLPEGIYLLSAESVGYRSFQKQIYIIDSKTTIEDIKLETENSNPVVEDYKPEQTNKQSSGLYLGDIMAIVSMPMGNFGGADISTDKAGFAKTGFGLSYEYSRPFNSKSGNTIKWLLTAAYVKNSFDSEALQQLRRTFWNDNLLKIGTATYTTTTAQFGLQINPDFGGFAPYITGSGGLLVSSLSDITQNGVVATFSTGFTYCYSVGAGVKIGKIFHISARYIATEIQYTVKSSLTEKTMKQPYSALNLMAGFSFDLN